jgi:hypothetical protein
LSPLRPGSAPLVAFFQENSMKREVIRVEPLSTWLERWKAPMSVVTRRDIEIDCVAAVA